MITCDIQNLENRLFLNGADPLSIELPSPIREGHSFSLVYTAPPIGSPTRIKRWVIDWGDGTISRSNKPTPPAHAYNEFGLYSIFIEAKPRSAALDTETVNLLADVENIKPAPTVISFSRAVPNQPMDFTFKTGDSAPRSHLALSWSISTIASLPFTPADDPEARSFSCTFSTPGKYTVRVRVRDGDNALGTFSKTVIIAPVVLQKDSQDPTRINLVAGGTDKDDVISFQNRWSGVEAFVNGLSYGIFKPTGKILAFGGRNDDNISVDDSVTFGTRFFGQAGDDTLAGGAGVNDLDGGTGRDLIIDPNA